MVVATGASDAAGRCEFPADWRGTWFESGVGDVIVTSRNVSRKGVCLENVDNFFLLENQCVLRRDACVISVLCRETVVIPCVIKQSQVRLTQVNPRDAAVLQTEADDQCHKLAVDRRT